MSQFSRSPEEARRPGSHQPPSAPNISQPTAPRFNDPKQGAVVIAEGFGPSIMASVAGSMAQVVGVGGFQEYRNNLVQSFGDPKDPIERMMLDQLVWLHLRAAELLVTSADSKLQAQQAATFTAAAARLFAEFRKSSLALREYGSPIRQRPNLTVVTNSNTQVAVVDGQAEVRHPEKNSLKHELVSNQAAVAHEKIEPFNPQCQTRASGTPEPRETRQDQRSRKSEPPQRRITMPPVVMGDGSTDDGWLGAGVKKWIPEEPEFDDEHGRDS